jgi:type I restriction enzyme S subunit
VIPGDIIISCAGTLGETYVIPENAPKGIINQALLKLNINNSIMDTQFFLTMFKAIIQQQIVLSSLGSAMKNLTSISWLKESVIFPLPPLTEQRSIVCKVDNLMSLCDELEAAEKDLGVLEERFAEYLPKSIQQAAVQGKLVPQNPKDEPASELLKRIRQEKARLIRDGKIKKEKPLPPISEDEIPYELPEGWAWCRLSDIGEIVGGATPLTSEPSYYTTPGKGIAWITPADMKNAEGNYISRGNKDITIDGYNSCSTRIIPSGSVIFSSRAPIGLLAYAENELCTNQGFKSVIPFDMAQNEWIYYALKSIKDSIISRASGTTFLEVSGEFMRKETIPFPPFAEQQRIVAEINKLMLICDELKNVQQAISSKDAFNVIAFPQKVPDNTDDLEIDIAARSDNFQKPSKKLQQAIDDWDDI